MDFDDFEDSGYDTGYDSDCLRVCLRVCLRRSLGVHRFTYDPADGLDVYEEVQAQ